MIKNNTAELIKAHKDSIITKIEQAEVISLTPGFYGTYDLYMDECGEVYIYQIFNADALHTHKELLFLCSIPSNAIDDKQAFCTYLRNELGITVSCMEAEPFKTFAQEYGIWKQERMEAVKQNVTDADYKYFEILSQYETEL